MEKDQKKKMPLAVKIIIPVAVAGIVCAVLFAVVLPLINYNTAMALFEACQYEDAGDQFRSLGSYKDSVMMLARSLYREGEQDYEEGDFEDAVDPFEELSSYYPDMEVLVTDAQYMSGVVAGVDGNYKQAIKALEKVKDYSNAIALLKAAEEENAKPFLDEALTHVLPVTEDEIIEVVEAYQQYADDVPEDFEFDFEASPASTPQASIMDSADWLVEAVCESEGVKNLDELKEAYDFEYEITIVILNLDQEGLSKQATVYLGYAWDQFQVILNEDITADVLAQIEGVIPQDVIDCIPQVESVALAYALRIDALSEDNNGVDLTMFGVNRLFFTVNSDGDMIDGETTVSIVPEEIVNPISNDEFWTDYMSAINFDSITQMENIGKSVVGNYLRTLQGTKYGYTMMLVSDSWIDYPNNVTVFIHGAQTGGVTPTVAPTTTPTATPTVAPTTTPTATPTPTPTPTNTPDAGGEITPEDLGNADWLLDAASLWVGMSVEGYLQDNWSGGIAYVTFQINDSGERKIIFTSISSSDHIVTFDVSEETFDYLEDAFMEVFPSEPAALITDEYFEKGVRYYFTTSGHHNDAVNADWFETGAPVYFIKEVKGNDTYSWYYLGGEIYYSDDNTYVGETHGYILSIYIEDDVVTYAGQAIG